MLIHRHPPPHFAQDPIETAGLDDLRAAFYAPSPHPSSHVYRAAVMYLPVNPGNLHGLALYLTRDPQTQKMWEVARRLGDAARHLGHLRRFADDPCHADRLIHTLNRHSERLTRIAQLKAVDQLRRHAAARQHPFDSQGVLYFTTLTDPLHVAKTMLEPSWARMMEGKFGARAGYYLRASLASLSVRSIKDLLALNRSLGPGAPEESPLRHISAHLGQDAAQLP
ncbi:MAG: hypothetical protein RIR70_2077 [Pseudomonadota bacterium]